MTVKKSSLLKILYSFIVILILLNSLNHLSIKDLVIDFLIIIFFSLYSFNKNKSFSLQSFFLKDKIYVIQYLPWVIIFIYSLVIQLAEGLGVDYIKHTFFLSFRMIEYIIFAFMAVQILKENMPVYLLKISFICYLPFIVKYFLQYGIINGITNLFTDNIYFEQVSLEVHGLTYIFGFLSLYFLFLYIFFSKEGRNLYCFIFSFILLFLGVKRIAIFGCILCYVLIFVLKFFYSISKGFCHKIMYIFSIAMCFFALGYVYLIYSGNLERVFVTFEINSNSRLYFWNYFKNKYNFSMFFLGHGISFSHRAMVNEYENLRIGAVTDLHNDILGIYMGLGLIGSFLYWIWFFYIRVRTMAKINYESSVFALVLLVNYFIMFSVSNCGLNPFVNSVVCALLVVMSQFVFNKREVKTAKVAFLEGHMHLTT